MSNAPSEISCGHDYFQSCTDSALLFLFAVRYYETDAALQSHWRSKVHKRRLKQLREPAYTIEESERAAGLGREDRRPTAVASSEVMVDAV